MKDITIRDDGIDWLQFKDHVIKHNKGKKKKVRASRVLVIDESLGSFIPRLVSRLFAGVYLFN